MKKSCLAVLFIVFIIPFQVLSQISRNHYNPAFISALENTEEGVSEAIPYPVKLGYDSYQTKESNSFPAYFDLRDLNVLPPVKSQSSGGCWAYSSMSTVESRMLVLGEGLYNLSDNNLKYCHGFFDSRSTNGNAWMATAYFARQSGPLLEEQDPHPGGTSLPGVDCPVDEAPAFLVRDSRYPPGDMATIKQLVMDIGSIWSLIYYNASYFDSGNNTYYYNVDDRVNHVLNIVGWDDNMVTAGGTGAWICQNTYGPGWGDGGFVYVSYFDSSFLIYNAYFPTFEEYDANSRVLLYDELGNYFSVGYDQEVGYALLKYPIYESLIIDKIGTYAMAYGTQIEMELYTSFNESTGSLSNQIGGMTSKTTDHPGYYTYSLDQTVSVEEGSNLYIKVKYTTPSYDWPIPIEEYIDTYSDPYIESGVSWISETGQAGDWDAVGSDTASNFDLCVNVYGELDTEAIPLSNWGLLFSFFGIFLFISIKKTYFI